MNLYEFGSKHAETYSKKCSCGKTIEVSTKKDEHSEYLTEIHVKCDCGDSVCFNLPVN